MELILTDVNGIDIRRLEYIKTDFDIGGDNDFEIIVNADEWKDDVQFGARIYVPNTEYGGIIGELETNTADNTVTLRGFTWRGLLQKKIIIPAANQAYRTVSGDLAVNLSNTIANSFDGIIKTDTNLIGISLTYSYDRYTDMLSGLSKMLLQKNYKLKIEYKQKEKGAAGFVLISAVPVIDYSDKIELSQDSRMDFIMKFKRNVINHLIVLGSGELENRNVLNLYLHPDGSIKKFPYYSGIEEIAEVYEYTGSEDLESDGIAHFQELIETTAVSMDIAVLDIDVDVGDIVGGRDYITGLNAKKPLASIIVTDNGVTSIEYRLAE